MAYDDSRFRGEPGFRDEPDFRAGVPEDAPTLGVSQQGQSVYTPGAYPVEDYGMPVTADAGAGRRTPSAAQLDNVFDDPEHGDPGRDRMAVHALWEIVLLLGAAALAYLLRDSEPSALRGNGLRELMLVAAQFGLVAVAMGLSLRAAVPNLAVGPLAYASALFFADNSGRGLLLAAGLTALVALGAGVVLTVLVAGFHVPSWAASLGVAFGLLVWISEHRVEEVVNGAYAPRDHALYWLLGVLAVALLGGVLGMVKPIRRAVGRFRPIGDPARRRGAGAATYAALALIGSSLFAAVAGVLIALDTRRVENVSDAGLALTALALGAALLGGTSAFGRRGGLFGTVLAVVLVTLLLRYAEAERWDLAPLTVAAGAIVAGLVVTRLVETFGRPRVIPEPVEEDEEWSSSCTSASTDTSWSAARTSGGWASQMPARTTDEGWGAEERWGTR